MSLHRGIVGIYEGIRQYPIVYYYHSRRAYRSLPFAHHNRVFFETAARDLGYEIEGGPGEKLF